MHYTIGRFFLRAAATSIAVLPVVGMATAHAATPLTHAHASVEGSRIDHIANINARQADVFVYSAAMNRVIQLQVIRPADTGKPRPTLYLLNGAGDATAERTWQTQTDLVGFFADKNVNVVTVVGGTSGEYSYYTDWDRDDPTLGRNKWKTFLTQELPPVLNSALGSSGKNSIAGVSMSGSAVLSLAESAPGLYQSVGAYSGCAATSSDPGEDYVKLVVDADGHANTDNMWGPVGSPEWAQNDAYVNADKLRGIKVVVASGNGLPGPSEAPSPLLAGGVIEAAVDQCTQRLADRLDALGSPAALEIQSNGLHAWPYWQNDLHRSWPIMAAAMGISPT